MIRTYWNCLLAAAALCGAASVASAQEVPASVHACAEEADDARRLACYDREVARQATTPEERFGVQGDLARKKAAANPTPQLEKLDATITAISRRPHGELAFTLQNGQVWVQKQASAFPVEVGDAVSIKPGALGSYVLTTPAGRYTKVARVK